MSWGNSWGNSSRVSGSGSSWGSSSSSSSGSSWGSNGWGSNSLGSNRWGLHNSESNGFGSPGNSWDCNSWGSNSSFNRDLASPSNHITSCTAGIGMWGGSCYKYDESCPGCRQDRAIGRANTNKGSGVITIVSLFTGSNGAKKS